MAENVSLCFNRQHCVLFCKWRCVCIELVLVLLKRKPDSSDDDAGVALGVSM